MITAQSKTKSFTQASLFWRFIFS